MRYEETAHLGVKMPLTINKDTVSLKHFRHAQKELKKDEVVYFDTFTNYDHEEKKQYFMAVTSQGDKVYLEHSVVELPKAIFHKISEEDKKDNFKNVNDIEKGMKVLSLDDEVSEIGDGLIVEVVKIVEVFGKDDAIVLVRNQWGGEDTTSLRSLKPVAETYATMTKKQALELAIKALVESEITLLETKKEDALKLLEELKEAL